MLMETRRFEKQPGLVKMHKVATVLMWISWALFFVAMLGAGNYFSLFSWISFQLKTVKDTGWQLFLTGGFLIMFWLLSMRLFY